MGESKILSGKKQSPFGALFSESILYLSEIYTCATNRINMHNPFLHTESFKGLFLLSSKVENTSKKVCSMLKLFLVSYKEVK